MGNKFTERVVDEALARDLSAQAGAHHLAKCLRSYWARQGVTIQTDVVVTAYAGDQAIWGVKTIGIPVAAGMKKAG